MNSATRRFIIVMEGAPAAVVNAVTNALKETPWGVWKQLNNSWLVTRNGEDLTAKTLSDWLENIPGVKDARWLVLRVDSGSTEYWGSLPTAAWSWFPKEWK
jgi:hypothetical protein